MLGINRSTGESVVIWRPIAPLISMKRFVYQLHLILGIFVSIPVLAWALSGFLYALPNTVEGGTVVIKSFSKQLMTWDAPADELAVGKS